MENKLVFRPLIEGDYEDICKWWKWWRWPVLPKESLPDNGMGGFMVEKNGTPIVSVFLYLTSNSNWAWLEWLVSNPNYREKDRKEAIELLISKTEEETKKLGFKFMLTIGRNKSLIESHRKLGWHVDDKGSHEIIKNL